MKSINEINQMTPEELDAESKKLMKKVLIRNILIPIAVVTVVHIGVNYLLNRMEDAPVD